MTHTPAKNKADAERDLLFGIIAVQLGLASTAQVMTAASQWAVDRSVGLARRLEQEGIVAPERSAMIQSMVAEAVEAHSGDTQRTLDTFGGERAIAESFGGSIVLSPDGEIVSKHELKPITTDETEDGEPTVPSRLQVTPVVPGRYSLRDKIKHRPTNITQAAEIGRGGIGRVLVAFDEHLGRQVALKELLPVRVGGSLDKVRYRPDQSDGKGNGRVKPVMSIEKVSALVARFLREARVTGQLEHPNIVPVYELGRNLDDTLYYTMKMVRGRTMAESLDESHSLSGRLKLLGHFVDVCQAIAYAHSRGVVHRDLKPDNVMLGEFGETVVLDWGLAKVRGTQDIRGQEIEREIQLLRDVAAGHTVDGTAIGTPAYMSPEQAEGTLKEIDELSDVWSLGAVLYQLLTGRPPYEGASAYEVIGKVIKDPVRPVREVCPEAPAELASVCEKALTRERAGRYQSAKALAADVDAYLTGGRVRAYDYRLADLLRRVVVRHKMAFAVGGIGLVLLLLLGVWSYLRVVEDRDRAQELRTAAEEARQKARVGWAEALWEGARAARMRGDMLEARAKLRSSLQVTTSVAGRVLWKQCQQEPLVWTRKLGAMVYDVAVAPDGKHIAVAGHDGFIDLLDMETSEDRILRRHEPWVATLAYSGDGKLLASAGADKRVLIWSTAKGEVLHTFEGHTAAIHDVAITPAGDLVATGGQDHTVRMWRVGTGEEIMTAKVPDVPWVVGFTPDGKNLVVGLRTGAVRFYDPATGKHSFTVEQPRVGLSPDEAGGVSALDISSDGRWLASGSTHREIFIWDLQGIAEGTKPVRLLKGHTDGVAELQFSPDGELLASGSYDKSVRLWRVGDLASSPRGDLKETSELLKIDYHGEFTSGIGFGPNGRFLVTGSEDRKVALWELPIQRQRREVARGHTDMATGLHVDPSGQRIVSYGADKTVRIWDLATGEERAVLRGHTGTMAGARFTSPHTIHSADWGKKVHVWNLGPESSLKTHRVVEIGGKGDPMSSMVFDPEARFVAFGDYDRTIRVCDLTRGTERKLVGHEDYVRDLSLNASGTRLITASWDKTIRIWDPMTGRQLQVIRGHSQGIDAIDINVAGDQAVSASLDQTIRHWDMKTGKSRIESRKGGKVSCLRISPDGKHLAISDEQGLITVQDLGKPANDPNHSGPKLMSGHRDVVEEIRFTPDSAILASVSDDGTVRTWDVLSGRPHWRAPVMLPGEAQPPRVRTHLGWHIPGNRDRLPKPSEAAWLEAAEGSLHTVLGEAGRTACSQLDNDRFAMWDRLSDNLVLQKRFEGIEQVEATGQGCAVRAKGRVYLVTGRGEPKEITNEASTMAWSQGQLLVARGGEIRIFEASGFEREALKADRGITSLVRIDSPDGDRIVMGYQDGTVELLPLSGDQERANLSLEEVPSSPVVRMFAGPKGTAILGYANGLLGIWDLQTGARLDHVKLHGPVAHARIWRGRLYVATELGDHLAWDLRIFHTPHCQLMEEIWSKVPVTWEGGRPVRKPPPNDHPCRTKAMGAVAN